MKEPGDEARLSSGNVCRDGVGTLVTPRNAVRENLVLRLRFVKISNFISTGMKINGSIHYNNTTMLWKTENLLSFWTGLEVPIGLSTVTYCRTPPVPDFTSIAPLRVGKEM